MTSEQYNGWTNRETWLANIWLDAGEVEQGAFIRLATELSASELADSLEEYYASVLPELPSGLYADLLAGAVERINWREIAKKLWEEVQADLSPGMAKEFGDYRSAEEMAIAYPRKTLWTEAEGSK